MVVYSPSTHKDVVNNSTNPKDAVRIDGRAKLAKLLGSMGLFSIPGSNIAPSNKDDLWWHIDVNQVKRFNAVLGNWAEATPDQIGKHLARQAIIGAVNEINLETGDLFTFWDVSLGEIKVISRDNLINALGALRTVNTTEGIQGGGALNTNRTLKLDINGLVEKTDANLDDMIVVYDVTAGIHRKIAARKMVSSNSGIGFFYSGH